MTPTAHPLFDSHCHLNHDFDAPIEALLRQAQRDAGLGAVVVPAVSAEDWQECASYTFRYPGFAFAALGIHPEALDLDDEALAEALGRLPVALERHDAVAVGEIGLDHRLARGEAAQRRQRAVFRRQLAVARELGLTAVVHCVRAHHVLREVLEQDGAPAPGVVLHGFTGSRELVEVYVELGAYISFAGPVTWDNARKIPEACAATPAERLLIETDAPWQAPAPHRGDKGRPAYLLDVARVVAEVRGEPLEAIAAQTWDNAARVFQLEGRLGQGGS